MNSAKTKLITLLVMYSLFTACSLVQESTGLTKRKYRKGFYRDWLIPRPDGTAEAETSPATGKMYENLENIEHSAFLSEKKMS